MTNSKRPLIILGIDPGTRVTGYGLVSLENNELKPIDFGCIKPKSTLSLHDRYLVIHEGIESLIQTYQPDAISVETQFVKKNVQIALKLGMARGVILLAGSKNKIPIFEYAPRKAKQAVVGNGSASKIQVQKMVQCYLKLPSLPEPEDAADALALAICHAHNLRFKERILS